MDPRHLKLYNEELFFIRQMGKIFADNNPDVAGRLGLLGDNQCSDPYVERLLEGFAFLSSRIQLQYEEEFPKFTQHLLDIIYPDFLTPLPSMSIVQFNPDTNGKLKEEGVIVSRKTKLLSPLVPPRSRSAKVDKSIKPAKCEFRTSQNVHLWPIEIKAVDYFLPEDIPNEIEKDLSPSIIASTQGVIKLSLQTTDDNIAFSDLKGLNQLVLYLAGDGSQSGKLYEALLAHVDQIVLHHQHKRTTTIRLLDKDSLRGIGFDEETALLPVTRRGFQGYRYLQEYFADRKRFMFISLDNIDAPLQAFTENAVDIYFLLNQIDENLRATIGKENIKLNCTPVINLFEKTADHVHLTKHPPKAKYNKNKKDISHYLPGHPVIVEKSQPRNFEIYRILSVKGLGNYQQEDVFFHPFYSLDHSTLDAKKQSFYTLQRHSEIRAIRDGDSAHYQGHETYISIADDAGDLPYSSKIKELRIKTLATNRGLSLYLKSGRYNFTTPDNSLPVMQKNGIVNIENFTPPRPSHQAGEHTWKLINLLSLNHLSLVDDGDNQDSIKALRNLLELQIHTQRVGDTSQQYIQVYRTQINRGLRKVSSEKIVHPLFVQGKITYARGLQITITLDEQAFEGGSAFLFGSVLERFFSQYTSINSFTQTIVRTLERGEIMKWPVRKGRQKSL
jgi:type VI secretion system protein ImpG